MGYLLHLVLALTFQATAEVYGPWAKAVWLVPVLVLVPHVLGAWSRRMYLAGHFKRADLGFQLLFFSPPVLHWFALVLGGWHVFVSRTSGWPGSLLEWPDPGTLLVFAPYVVFGILALDARARFLESHIARVRAFHVRMFLSGVVPLALYGLLSWLVGRREEWRVLIEEVSLWNAVFAASLVAMFASLLPFILRNTWQTRPMPEGWERRLFDAVAERARFRCREVLLWITGRQMANAAIVGLLPWQRVVLVSDALLAQLPPRELAAVYGHEIGHARRGHVWILGGWTMGLLLVADAAATRVAPESEMVHLALFGVGVLAWYVSFGWFARRFELDADCYSWRLLGTTGPLKTALEWVGGVHTRDRESWRHFSTARRIAFLEDLERSPRASRQVDRTVRGAAVAAALLFAIGLGWQLAQLVASYAEERVFADLRLGRFADARARSARLDEVHPQVAAWVELTNEIGDGATDADALERAALSAWRRGEEQRALDLLGLAILRGRDDLEQVRRALVPDEEADEPDAESLQTDFPQWARVLKGP